MLQPSGMWLSSRINDVSNALGHVNTGLLALVPALYSQLLVANDGSHSVKLTFIESREVQFENMPE